SIARFGEGYGMTAEQVALAQSLFVRKAARPPALIELSSDEILLLESTFKDPKCEYAKLDRLMGRSEEAGQVKGDTQGKWWEGIDTAAEFEKAKQACREKLAELGIIFP